MLTAGYSVLDSVAQFITVLVLFVVVIGITWCTTRLIGGYQKGRMKTTNFEAVDSFALSQNKYLQILRVGDRYLVIAVCKDTVTLLTELEEESLVLRETDRSAEGFAQFDDILKKASGLLHRNEEKAADKHEKDDE